MKKFLIILTLMILGSNISFSEGQYQIQKQGGYTFSEQSNPSYQVINTNQLNEIKKQINTNQNIETKVQPVKEETKKVNKIKKQNENEENVQIRYTPLYTDKSADSEKPQITITDTVKLIPVNPNKPVQILEKNKQVLNKKTKKVNKNRIPPIADPAVLMQYSKDKKKTK